MIDFIKAYTHNKHVAARLRNTICTNVEADHSTGEIIAGEYFGKCSEFKMSVYPSDRIQISGSLHKYHSSGMNCSDFTFPQLCQTIFSLCELLGLKPENVVLENLEFGVNIELPYCPSIVLNNIICLPRGEVFSEQAGQGLKSEKREYRHKIYNKSAQYKFNRPNLLRYEIHVDKMRWVSPVKTLQDLTRLEIWDMLQEKLLRSFKQIIFADEYNIEIMRAWDKTNYEANRDRYNSRYFWKNLNPCERSRHLTRLKKIQLSGKMKFSNELASMIEEKVSELKTCYYFPVQLLRENIA